MIPQTTHKLDEFFLAFSASSQPFLLLDYDGTLAPFQLDRFQAYPWDGVRERLAAIQGQGRTRMRIITGRPAEEIRPLLGLDPPLEVWGLHGAERLHSDGRRELEQASPQVQKALEKLRETLRRDSFGGLFEDKANGAVMHWRGTSPEDAKRIEIEARRLFEPLARMEGLSLLEFESGIELRVGRDKGHAIQAILAEAQDPAAAPVAFLGDDITDEAAFHAVRRLDRPNLTALVRPEWRETEAELWFHPPEELNAFLDLWLHTLGIVGVR